MTRQPADRNPDPIGTVRDLLAGVDDRTASATFLRGLTLGALIGAAIAGSAIWQRRGRGRRGRIEVPPDGPATGEGGR